MPGRSALTKSDLFKQEGDQAEHFYHAQRFEVLSEPVRRKLLGKPTDFSRSRRSPVWTTARP